MNSLLEKMKRMNCAFFKSGMKDYNEIAGLLSEIIEANVYIIKDDGVVVGHSIRPELCCDVMKEICMSSESINNYELLKLEPITAPRINVHYKDGNCLLKPVKCVLKDKIRSVWSIYVNGESKGFFIVAKFAEELTEEEIILCEHAVTCVSIVAMHQTYIREAEIERKRQQISMGFETLSYSEMKAVGRVLSSLEGDECLLVASKIADKAGITRSVIVNALRKLASAGLIETRSLGMKGTYIKIKNDLIFKELKIER